MRYNIIFFIIISLVPSILLAKESKMTFGKWTVHAREKDNQLYCFMMSTPEKKDKTSFVRETPYVMITHLDSRNDEFSVTSGYKYKNTLNVDLKIDRLNYDANLVKGDMAWIKSKNIEKRVIYHLKKGHKLITKGVSAKTNEITKDTYSLKGFSRAYKRMKYLCSHVNLS